MPTGRTIFFDSVRGFGFISPDVVGPDLFVHKRHLANRDVLRQDDRVQFEISTDNRGKLHADRVRVI